MSFRERGQAVPPQRPSLSEGSTIGKPVVAGASLPNGLAGMLRCLVRRDSQHQRSSVNPMRASLALISAIPWRWACDSPSHAGDDVVTDTRLDAAAVIRGRVRAPRRSVTLSFFLGGGSVLAWVSLRARAWQPRAGGRLPERADSCTRWKSGDRYSETLAWNRHIRRFVLGFPGSRPTELDATAKVELVAARQ